MLQLKNCNLIDKSLANMRRQFPLLKSLNVEENYLTEFVQIENLEADGNFIPGYKMRQLTVSEYIRFKFLSFDVEFMNLQQGLLHISRIEML